jgi:hypothetical protein
MDWFFTREQEASTEALAHRWDPSGAAAVQRLEQFLDEVGGGGGIEQAALRFRQCWLRSRCSEELGRSGQSRCHWV